MKSKILILIAAFAGALFFGSICSAVLWVLISITFADFNPMQWPQPILLIFLFFTWLMLLVCIYAFMINASDDSKYNEQGIKRGPWTPER